MKSNLINAYDIALINILKIASEYTILIKQIVVAVYPKANPLLKAGSCIEEEHDLGGPYMGTLQLCSCAVRGPCLFLFAPGMRR